MNDCEGVYASGCIECIDPKTGNIIVDKYKPNDTVELYVVTQAFDKKAYDALSPYDDHDVPELFEQKTTMTKKRAELIYAGMADPARCKTCKQPWITGMCRCSDGTQNISYRTYKVAGDSSGTVYYDTVEANSGVSHAHDK